MQLLLAAAEPVARSPQSHRRHTMKHRLIRVGAPVALVGVAAALGLHAASRPSQSSAPKPKADAVLRIAVSSDLDSTDPALAYTTQSWAVEYATCLKLITYPD